MADSFNLFEYLRYLNNQRRWLVAAVGVAAAVALVISLMLAPRYTATTRLIIEPPAGTEARVPQVVTPQYLESLRTFESLATSDSLFERAMERFGLRKESPGRAVESWKKSTLRSGLIRNTRVLEIAITLPDARKAHGMALFLAEQTIAASRDLHRSADDEMVADAQDSLVQAQKSFDEAEARLASILRLANQEALNDEIESLLKLRNRVERKLVDASVNEAGGAGRRSADSAAARVKVLRSELDAVKKSLADTNARLAAWKEQNRPVVEKHKAALARLESARKRVEDTRAIAGLRGERLRLIDAGIVPERPSSPNVALNVIGAAMFALVAALAYLSLRYGASHVVQPG